MQTSTETDNTEDLMLCKVCGGESTTGIIGFKNGSIYHFHLCDRHAWERKMYDNQCVEKKPAKKKLPKEVTQIKKLGFRVKQLNKGKQLVLKKSAKTFDYWPSSGKWICRSDGSSGVGHQSLAEFMG